MITHFIYINHDNFINPWPINTSQYSEVVKTECNEERTGEVVEVKSLVVWPDTRGCNKLTNEEGEFILTDFNLGTYNSNISDAGANNLDNAVIFPLHGTDNNGTTATATMFDGDLDDQYIDSPDFTVRSSISPILWTLPDAINQNVISIMTC